MKLFCMNISVLNSYFLKKFHSIQYFAKSNVNEKYFVYEWFWKFEFGWGDKIIIYSNSKSIIN